MTVVIDQHIPFVAQALSQVAHVIALEPESITAAAVRDADALIVRTRTRVDRALLEGARVRFVATATIGFDHIDTHYCDEHGILWMCCPGCNAQAVCDYVEEALDTLYTPHELRHLTIGVVGVGHVGALVADMANQKGMQVLLSDAPKHIGVSLDEIARTCDIITFHTPLTYTNDYPTYHLCDAALLSTCRSHALIINAARGGVVDEQALLLSDHPCVIDCWENEPLLNPTLLHSPFTCLASFHIAGYSLQGKYNASCMCVEALADYFAIPPVAMPAMGQSDGDNQSGWLRRVTETLRDYPDGFEELRKSYKLR